MEKYEELKKSIDNAVYEFENKLESNEKRTYTTQEVLAILYAIRDCE